MSKFPPIRKAVFPVAGLGTRFLPATKSTPKEMLPIVDKPLIQYAVEEALEAGIKTLVFIVSRKKHSISDHFDTAFELEARLAESGQTDLLQKIQDLIPPDVSRAHVPQLEARGLGHAVLCAKAVIGNEPFAVLLADDLIRNPGRGCLRQMIEHYNEHGNSLLAVEQVPAEQTNRYGIIATDSESPSLIEDIVEKPDPADAPSDWGVVGRYILSPDIFPLLAHSDPGAGGEIQLTDSIAKLLKSQTIEAFRFEGQRYDCGSKAGFVKATIDLALEDPDLREQLADYLRSLSNRIGLVS